MNATKTVLEEFTGVLERIDGDVAHVTLTSKTTGEILWGEYPATELADLGIREGRRFQLRTVQVDIRTIRIEMEAIPDKEISPERKQEIYEEIDRLLGDPPESEES